MKNLIGISVGVMVWSSATKATAFTNDEMWCTLPNFSASGEHPTAWNVHPCPTSACAQTAIPVREVCGATPNSLFDEIAGTGYWMWQREGALRAYLFWDQSATCSSGLSWEDLPNNFDFVGPFGAAGLEGSDPFFFCFQHTGHWRAQIESSDIKVDETSSLECAYPPPPPPGNNPNCPPVGSTGVQSIDGLINNVTECVTRYNPLCDTTLHEVGHSLGLDHENDFPTLMKGANGATHMCNIGFNGIIRNQPHADDMNGAVSLYGRNTNNIKNLSGMAFFELNGGESITAFSQNQCSTFNLNVSFTLMNYYAPPSSISFRPAVVPIANSTPNAGGVAAFLGTSSISSITRGMSRKVTTTIAVNPTPLAAGCYRIWIQVDPASAVAESDEGDNWFPLAATFCRNGCP